MPVIVFDNFLISDHAKLRLHQRLNCSRQEKIMRIVKKAWMSSEQVPPEFFNKKMYFGEPQETRYRYMMGYVWVFKVYKKGGLHRLITVF